MYERMGNMSLGLGAPRAQGALCTGLFAGPGLTQTRLVLRVNDVWERVIWR